MAAHDGAGRLGVLLCGEALGEREAERGLPFQGPSGLALEQMLQRAGLTRNDFWIENVLHCRPPGNELRGTSYEEAALNQCEVYLRQSIEKLRPKVAVALGATALRRLLDLPADDCVLEHRTRGRRGYVEWSGRYGLWVVATYHPAYLLRGQWSKTGAFLHDIQTAVRIAKDGFAYRPPKTLVDPDPVTFRAWAAPYLAAPGAFWLAVDSETDEKRSESEDELEFNKFGQIERVSLAFRPGEGCSVPWTAEYIGTIRAMLAAPGVKLIWNRAFDKPLFEQADCLFGGPVWDMMYGWHILHSTLPKGINYVAPFLIPHYPRWKFRNDSDPGIYSAMDASGLLDMSFEIVDGLKREGLWDSAFERQTHLITDATEAMTSPGVLVDTAKRIETAKSLQAKQGAALQKMQAIVPTEMLKWDPPNGFVREPADKTGLLQLHVQADVKVCSRCGAEGVTKSKHTQKKKDNPCHGAEIVVEKREIYRWARVIPFSPSNKQLQDYQRIYKHRPVLNEEKNATFDADAMKILMRRYPDDQLYPLIHDYRKPEKMLGYTGRWNEEEQKIEGGWPTRFGRLFPVFGHNPSTGRMSCSSPNLQQIPKPDEDAEEAAMVRALFIPEPGCVIVEVDYSAIEAVLVGYFANDRDFHRLARLGVHDYLNGHILYDRGVISEAPDLNWSDADLKLCFADLKQRFEPDREVSKRVVYLSLYGGTPFRMFQSYPDEFKSLANAGRLQAFFFSLFPKVRKWQNRTVDLAASQGYLRGVWGHVMRFWKVYEWRKNPGGQWEKIWGKDAKSAIAFPAQHAASGILKETVLRIRERHPEIFPCLRLLIHDSIFAVPKIADVERVVDVISAVAQEPIPQLELPWSPGEYLRVGVEAKVCYENWSKPAKLKK